jgi:hypothetical protein
MRPGDFIRFLGYVPNKLRQALAGLEREAARALAQGVDAMCGGMARDLRTLADELSAIEHTLDDGLAQALAPLAEAHAHAQLAVQLRWSGPDGAAAGVDLEAVAAAIARVAPIPLAEAIAGEVSASRDRLREVARLGAGEPGSELRRLAGILDANILSTIGGDLDKLLALLDPEPIAAELDRLCLSMIRKIPQLMSEVGGDARNLLDTLRSRLTHMNPLVQAQKLLRVFDVLRDELAVLDPATLADDLEAVHAAIVDAISAYDPASFTREIGEVFAAIAASIRAVDPKQWLRPEDLAFLTTTVDRVKGVVPSEALAGAGAALHEAGETLAAIHIDGLLGDVAGLRDRVVGEMEHAAEEIATEIDALLKSIKYAATSGSASASVSVSGGGS